MTFGNRGFLISPDSVDVASGKYAIAMEFTGNIVDYHAFTCKLPDAYAGDSITLSASMKTVNVTDGFAGLWLMVDPDPAWRLYVLLFMVPFRLSGKDVMNIWKRRLKSFAVNNGKIFLAGKVPLSCVRTNRNPI